MSSTKRLETYGIRGVIEASYLAGGAPGATDGILPMETPDIEFEYIHDGERGRSPTGGMLSRVAQSGRGATFDLISHLYTPGAAYSASVAPSLDKCLRAAGFNVTTNFGGGVESYAYSPDVDSLESMFYEVYVRGQRYNISGCYHNLQITSEDLQIPIWTFPTWGVAELPVDIAMPAITYPHVATQKPQKSVNTAVSFGAFAAAIVRGFEFDLGREMTQRADENGTGTGHRGWTPGPRAPRMTVTIEATALSAYDAYTLRDAGTEFAFSMRHGASGAPGQYRRWTLSMPQCQIITVDDTDDGPMAMLELELAPAVTPGNNNDISFLFD